MGSLLELPAWFGIVVAAIALAMLLACWESWIAAVAFGSIAIMAGLVSLAFDEVNLVAFGFATAAGGLSIAGELRRRHQVESARVPVARASRS